jgi:hypothetical protein
MATIYTFPFPTINKRRKKMVKQSEFVGYCNVNKIPYWMIESIIMFSLIGRKVDYTLAMKRAKEFVDNQ